MPRILITGSRQWSSVDAIHLAIDRWMLDTGNGPRSCILISGGARGVDRIAEEYAAASAMQIEQHLADWDGPAGKGAGMVRNLEMVKLGADVCLAFISKCDMDRCAKSPVHGSHGASHCFNAARKAGIPVRLYREDW